MRTNFLFTLSLLAFVFTAKASVLVVEGKYQNKNLYIQNGFNINGVGFCAYEVKVNGKVTTDEVNSSAFEVDLTPFKLGVGEKVTIEIAHKDGCIPKVLNPEVLKPRATFDVLSISVNSDGILNWVTRNEVGSLPYIVEQYKWNKWVYVGEVNGNGNAENNDYKFKVTTHSGENKFRVKQVGFGAQPRYSNPVIVNSMMDKPSFEISKDSKTITFSSETAHEVYDFYGNVVKKGFGYTLDISNLNKAKYYLCYDNIVTEIEKKK